MSFIAKSTFYYILPFITGFSLGLVSRDNIMLDINKKISMSLADYYEQTNTKPEERIYREFPEVIKLLKKIRRE